MCRTRIRWRPRAGLIRSHGLSVRYCMAMAHSITALMRWRTRRAVSGCACQMGPSVSSRSALVMSSSIIRYIGSRSARQPDGLPAFEAEEFFDHGTVEDRDREQV